MVRDEPFRVDGAESGRRVGELGSGECGGEAYENENTGLAIMCRLVEGAVCGRTCPPGEIGGKYRRVVRIEVRTAYSESGWDVNVA
jgi:hypothetical protein